MISVILVYTKEGIRKQDRQKQIYTKDTDEKCLEHMGSA